MMPRPSKNNSQALYAKITRPADANNDGLDTP